MRDRSSWRGTLGESVTIKRKQNLGWWHVRILGPGCYGWGIQLVGLKGLESWESCNGKAETDPSGLKLCWPIAFGVQVSRSPGNILQTFFASLSSGAVGTIVTGRACRGPDKQSNSLHSGLGKYLCFWRGPGWGGGCPSQGRREGAS